MILTLQKQYCIARVARTFLLTTGRILRSMIPSRRRYLQIGFLFMIFYSKRRTRHWVSSLLTHPFCLGKNPNSYCAFIMNFITLGSTSIYKNGGNNANYIQSNGQMTESCWQLSRLSLGDEIFFKSLRCDFWPFASHHKRQHGKQEDIFVRMTLQRSWSTSASLLRL